MNKCITILLYPFISQSHLCLLTSTSYSTLTDSFKIYNWLRKRERSKSKTGANYKSRANWEWKGRIKKISNSVLPLKSLLKSLPCRLVLLLAILYFFSSQILAQFSDLFKNDMRTLNWKSRNFVWFWVGAIFH